MEHLLTEDARYSRSRYEKSEVGHHAIKAFWLADSGETFDVSAAPVAVDGQAAVGRLDVSYHDPVQQEYRDLCVLQCLLLAPPARIALCSPPTSSSFGDEKRVPSLLLSTARAIRRRRRPVSDFEEWAYWPGKALHGRRGMTVRFASPSPGQGRQNTAR